MKHSKCCWAVMGCGTISHEFAAAMEALGQPVYGVWNRTLTKAEAFADRYGVRKVYERAEALLADPAVQVVYIATPHNAHFPYMMKALEAGKHVLCEKAITLNSAQLQRAASLARRRSLILAEAMTIYHMPLYRKIRQFVEEGNLGLLRAIQVQFGSYKLYDMTNRFFNPALAGGALLDIGVYALSFARWFMTSAPGVLFSDVELTPTGVDEASTIVLKNAGGEKAVVCLSLHAKQPKRGTIICQRGYIEIYDYPRADKAVVTNTVAGTREELRAGHADQALAYEIEAMEAAVAGAGQSMYLPYTEDVMDIMTSLRQQWHIVYPEEQ